MKKTSEHPEQIAWASTLATQVRFLQADFVDADEAQRKQIIEEEVRRSLQNIVPEKRLAHLRALAEYFPCGEGTVPDRNAAKVPSEPVDNSPEALVEQMIQLAPLLPKRKLQEFGLRLQQAGYMELKTATLVDDPPPEFLKTFGLEADCAIDIQRSYRLLQTFAVFIGDQDKLVWHLWRSMAPRSRIRRDATVEADVCKFAGRYLRGEEEISVTQISQRVDRLRQLVAGIIGAISPAARRFSKRYLGRFSPDAIRDLANIEKGGWSSLESRCWRKYVDLTKEQSVDAVETEMIDEIAGYADDLMRGTGRTQDN